MRHTKETQASESTDDHQKEPLSSQSRRGFLRKAAGTSIFGLTGLAATTGAACADIGGYDEEVYIYGDGPGVAYYRLKAVGAIAKGSRSEPYQGDIDGQWASGGVAEGYEDSYYVEYGLDEIHAYGAIIDYYVIEV